jgi:hypothetical protein
MADTKPTNQKGGANPSEDELREKGEWARTADEGIVGADQGGADAPRELQPEDPELGSAVTGHTTGSDEPATESGIDLSAGDNADAVRDGGQNRPESGEEPDLRDAGAGPRQVDVDAAQS